jgi:hypothetical protein
VPASDRNTTASASNSVGINIETLFLGPLSQASVTCTLQDNPRYILHQFIHLTQKGPSSKAVETGIWRGSVEISYTSTSITTYERYMSVPSNIAYCCTRTRTQKPSQQPELRAGPFNRNFGFYSDHYSIKQV